MPLGILKIKLQLNLVSVDDNKPVTLIIDEHTIGARYATYMYRAIRVFIFRQATGIFW